WKGKQVKVKTCCHPSLEAIAVRVEGAKPPIVVSNPKNFQSNGEVFSFKMGRYGPPSTEGVFQASAVHWENFWSNGASIDLSASAELERRVVLSQYLTAIQCAGSLPPQETGLTCNSWFGKFHLEMHFWHAAHFAHWRRPELLARSLDYYVDI